MAFVFAVATAEDARRAAAMPTPSGPGWNKLTVAKIERLIVRMSEDGENPPWIEFVGEDAAGMVVDRRRLIDRIS